VYGTGWHAAVRGGVASGSTVTVIGDGAVGLLAVLSAKQLGAELIVLMGRHQVRTDLGRELGATDVVAERGEEGIAQVRERAYIEQLLPAVLDGTVNPGLVFDETVALDDTAKGYAAMDDPTALKVLVRP
jgi:threonine dehydrogenase-like Zn-dependent dehydrogenase